MSFLLFCSFPSCVLTRSGARASNSECVFATRCRRRTADWLIISTSSAQVHRTHSRSIFAKGKQAKRRRKKKKKKKSSHKFLSNWRMRSRRSLRKLQTQSTTRASQVFFFFFYFFVMRHETFACMHSIMLVSVYCRPCFLNSFCTRGATPTKRLRGNIGNR